MNIIDVIKMGFDYGIVTEEDIERYVRERMITQKEADAILSAKKKEKTN